MMKTKFIPALSFLILSGCASTVQLGSYQNKGDQTPLVYSSQLLTKDFKNLSDGETVAMAIGNEKAIARPNLTEINVYKKIDNSSKLDFDLDIKLCDPDGDGILDIFCPARKRLADSNGAEYFDLAAIKFVLDKSGKWLHTINIDRDSVSGNIFAGQYRLILLNTGTKTYTGPLTAYDKLEPSMKCTGLKSVYKVVDHRELRSNLSVIPYIGLVTLVMDDFSASSETIALTDNVVDSVVKFESQSLSLKPGEGMQIDFGVNLTLP